MGVGIRDPHTLMAEGSYGAPALDPRRLVNAEKGTILVPGFDTQLLVNEEGRAVGVNVAAADAIKDAAVFVLILSHLSIDCRTLSSIRRCWNGLA